MAPLVGLEPETSGDITRSPAYSPLLCSFGSRFLANKKYQLLQQILWRTSNNLGSLVSKLTYFEDRLKEGFIIDPSLLSAPEGFGFISFLKENYEPKKVVIPTILYDAAKEKNYDKIAIVIKKWQWKLPRERILKWVMSSQFSKSVQILIESGSPASEFWRLEEDPSIVTEIAREIREISVKLGLPIVARSRSFYRWLRNEDVSIFELVDKHYEAFKAQFRKKYRESLKTRFKARGVEAGIDMFIALVALIEQTQVPPPWNLLIPFIVVASGKIIDKIYVAIVIDPSITV